MHDSGSPGGREPKKSVPSRGSAENGLTELRRLLLGDTEQHASDVARVLPDAVRKRTDQDDRLAESLASTIDESIHQSVKKNPRKIVDALSPVMMPAIRAAIANTIKGMIQTLNKTLEQSLSVRGLRWRFEAMRTGRPFAEVVLLRSLKYRVEQVFLIHRETGLLLQHVVSGSVAIENADVVSGMLTAIQDFVRDSFGAAPEDSVQTLEVGKYTVWVERGRKAVLAAVIRGNAPQSFRGVLQDALLEVHRELGETLDAFEGDAAPFEATRSKLEACCVEARAIPERSRRVSPILVALVLLVIAAAGWWIASAVRSHGRWRLYVERLEQEDGIVVLRTGKRGGTRWVEGLRDPHARDPAEILGTTELDPERIEGRWKPFTSSHPAFVLERANRILDPPESVILSFEDGVLHARGEARRPWIERARHQARALPEVERFDESDLADLDERRFTEIRNSVHTRIVPVTGDPPPDEEETVAIELVAAELERMAVAAEALARNVRVRVALVRRETGPVGMPFETEDAGPWIRELRDRLVRTGRMNPNLAIEAGKLEDGAWDEYDVLYPTYDRFLTFRTTVRDRYEIDGEGE